MEVLHVLDEIESPYFDTCRNSSRVRDFRVFSGWSMESVRRRIRILRLSCPGKTVLASRMH